MEKGALPMEEVTDATGVALDLYRPRQAFLSPRFAAT